MAHANNKHRHETTVTARRPKPTPIEPKNLNETAAMRPELNAPLTMHKRYRDATEIDAGKDAIDGLRNAGPIPLPEAPCSKEAILRGAT